MNQKYTIYISKEIQNQLIKLLSTQIQNSILSDLKKAKYYTIIMDCTPDVSRIEQMTMVIRFVDVVKKPEASIKEHFLGFVPVKDSSGEGLTECLLKSTALT